MRIAAVILLCALRCSAQFGTFSDLAFNVPSSSATFDPSNVTSATLFLRYQIDLLSFYTNGAKITNLLDFSGNGRNGILTAGDGNAFSNNPAFVNNRAYAQGGGSCYATNFTATSGTNTYFIICTRPLSGGGSFVFDGRGGDRQILLDIAGPLRAFAGTGLDFDGPADSAWTLFEIQFTGETHSYVKTNNVVAASGDAGANALGGITMFCRFNDVNFFDGRLAALLMFNGPISTADKASVYTWLNSRYGPF